MGGGDGRVNIGPQGPGICRQMISPGQYNPEEMQVSSDEYLSIYFRHRVAELVEALMN
jgi:hypothetical protein